MRSVPSSSPAGNNSSSLYGWRNRTSLRLSGATFHYAPPPYSAVVLRLSQGRWSRLLRARAVLAPCDASSQGAVPFGGLLTLSGVAARPLL